MKYAAVALIAILSGCAAQIVGVGENTRGEPVTAQLNGKYVEGKVEIKLNVITVDNGLCQGTATKKENTQMITSIPLECDTGKKGSATVTSDFINYRDTVVYQVGRERGRITFGLSTQISN